VRGGSTRTLSGLSNETSGLDAPVISSTGQANLKITESTDPAPQRDGLSQVVDAKDSIASAGEESNSKQIGGPHHHETRKEKRQRLKRHKQIAKQLKNRNARNMRRKVMHACFGLTFAGLNHWLPKATFVPCMALLSSATLVMELLRYRKGFGWMNAALHGVLGQSLRKHEMEGKFTGSFYFFTGVTLTSWLFDSTAATLGICQLALADPSASYFGRKTRHIYWSRIENGLGGFGRNKGVLGFLGGALFCVPFNYRVLYVAAKHSNIAGVATATTPVIIGASLALGLAGAFADLAVPTPALVLPKKILGVRVPPFHVDDNMVVPIFSAFACREIFRVLQLSQLELSRWVVI
jgi:dolichol kinase